MGTNNKASERAMLASVEWCDRAAIQGDLARAMTLRQWSRGSSDFGHPKADGPRERTKFQQPK